MQKLISFAQSISQYQNVKSIEEARSIVKTLNEFLYTNYQGIGTTNKLGQDWEYLSDFHKFWEKYHKDILNCKIDEQKCNCVADALHSIHSLTAGQAFMDVWNKEGLSDADVCRVRFLTANQDFRGSRNFKELANVYNSDPTIFDVDNIFDEPEEFVKKIGISGLSQNDKRISYAKNIALFLKDMECDNPYNIIQSFNNDISKLRTAMTSFQGTGYGNKKTDMFIRDMVVLGIWKDKTGFDSIDVASDVNTIKVALRTGILHTDIPLVSSFLDIFCYQYSYIDEQNAKAWRKVWEIWRKKYPQDAIASPCLLDYFIYNVVGKQFCKESLYTFECDTQGHTFLWHSGLNKTCQLCHNQKLKRQPAHVINKNLPCLDSANGKIAIHQTQYVKNLPANKKIDNCPFINICDTGRYLEPPKSISIMGQTGWTTAYADKNNGGGGLMA